MGAKAASFTPEYWHLTCFAEVEAASDILVNACLRHPQYFYATEVLGPACLLAIEGLGFLGSLTGMHSRRHCLANQSERAADQCHWQSVFCRV